MSLKIKVKDVKEFIHREYMLCASDFESSKKFWIALHVGPNVKRYVVENKWGELKSFKKVGDAVRYFNVLE